MAIHTMDLRRFKLAAWLAGDNDEAFMAIKDAFHDSFVEWAGQYSETQNEFVLASMNGSHTEFMEMSRVWEWYQLQGMSQEATDHVAFRYECYRGVQQDMVEVLNDYDNDWDRLEDSLLGDTPYARIKDILPKPWWERDKGE